MALQPPDTVRVDTKQIGVNQRLSGEAGILVRQLGVCADTCRTNDSSCPAENLTAVLGSCSALYGTTVYG